MLWVSSTFVDTLKSKRPPKCCMRAMSLIAQWEQRLVCHCCDWCKIDIGQGETLMLGSCWTQTLPKSSDLSLGLFYTAAACPGMGWLLHPLWISDKGHSSLWNGCHCRNYGSAVGIFQGGFVFYILPGWLQLFFLCLKPVNLARESKWFCKALKIQLEYNLMAE